MSDELLKELIRRLAVQDKRLERLETHERRFNGPGVVVYNDSNITIANADVNQWLTFNSEVRDDDGMHSTSTNTGRLTATRAGWYYVYAQVDFTGNATGRRLIAIRENTTVRIASQTALVVDANTVRLNASMLVYMTVNDYVICRAYQNSGGNLDVLYVAGESPYFGMVRVA